MKVKKGDVVIRKLKNSCDVRFVEGADETGVLLVNGIQDKFYEVGEFEEFNSEYELLLLERKIGYIHSFNLAFAHL